MQVNFSELRAVDVSPETLQVIKQKFGETIAVDPAAGGPVSGLTYWALSLLPQSRQLDLVRDAIIDLDLHDEVVTKLLGYLKNVNGLTPQNTVDCYAYFLEKWRVRQDELYKILLHASSLLIRLNSVARTTEAAFAVLALVATRQKRQKEVCRKVLNALVEETRTWLARPEILA